MYAEQAAADADGAAGGEGSADGGDADTVDAEFEEVNDDEKKG